MGRKKTSGNRSPSGRRKKPSTNALRADASRVLPTPETIAYIERRLGYWLIPGVWNLASAEQCYDNVGILWATGWFDNHGFSPDEIRNIFREYARLYWRWYGALAPKISKGERGDRAEPSNETEGWEKRFQRLDDRLRGMERRCVHELAVDGWFFDELHPRAMALANLGRVKLNAVRKQEDRLPIAGEIAQQRDIEWLEGALRGAFQLLDARPPQTDIPLWRLGQAA